MLPPHSRPIYAPRWPFVDDVGRKEERERVREKEKAREKDTK